MEYIKIQNADADEAERFDNTENSVYWKTIARGTDYEEAMEFLIRALNNEEVNIINGWLRIVNEKTGEIKTL